MSFADHDHPIWKILEELKDLVIEWGPMIVVMAITTSKWDGEYWVLAALGGSKALKSVIEGRLSDKKGRDNRSRTSSD